MSQSRTTAEAHRHPSRALLLGVKFNIPAAKDIPSTTEGDDAVRDLLIWNLTSSARLILATSPLIYLFPTSWSEKAERKIAFTRVL